MRTLPGMDESRGHDTVAGTKEEIINELTERLEYWSRMSTSDRKAARYADAIEGIEAGSFSVKVGQTIYSVVTSPSQHEDVPEPRTARDETADKPVS